MLQKYTFVCTLLAILIMSACKKDEPLITEDPLYQTLVAASSSGDIMEFALPSQQEFERIPQDPLNPITIEKFKLGQLLFHETGLGTIPKNNLAIQTYSCASCHQVEAGFQSGLRQGIGEGGLGFGIQGENRQLDMGFDLDSIDVQPIKSPTILNVAYQTNMLWNGQFGATGVNEGTEALWPPNTPIQKNKLGYEGVETQAIAGMTVHRQEVNKPLLDSLGYTAFFDQAFPEIPVPDRYTNEFAGLAMAAYERCVVADEAPFQKWLKGDANAMSVTEKKGAELFFGKANCVNCHKGPALNEMAFYAYGMNDFEANDGNIFHLKDSPSEPLGRGGFTKNPVDNFKFKVPQLYNLRDAGFYGHGASFDNIRDVVAYKAAGQAQNSNVPQSQLAADFQPLNLTEEEIDQLTAFITDALYDSGVDRHVPTGLPSGNCFPNADAQSKSDLGCD